MIIRHLQKLFRLIILILIRQTVLLAKNLYHLLLTPSLAINSLFTSRDKSQIFLLILTVFSPLWLYFLLRLTHNFILYGTIAPGFGPSFIVTLVVQLLLVFYCLYHLYHFFHRQ